MDRKMSDEGDEIICIRSLNVRAQFTFTPLTLIRMPHEHA